MAARGARLVHTTRLSRAIWQGNERRQGIGDGRLVTGAEAQRGKQPGEADLTDRERHRLCVCAPRPRSVRCRTDSRLAPGHIERLVAGLSLRDASTDLMRSCALRTSSKPGRSALRERTQHGPARLLGCDVRVPRPAASFADDFLSCADGERQRAGRAADAMPPCPGLQTVRYERQRTVPGSRVG